MDYQQPVRNVCVCACARVQNNRPGLKHTQYLVLHNMWFTNPVRHLTADRVRKRLERGNQLAECEERLRETYYSPVPRA